MDNNLTIEKILGHLKTVLTHKKWVYFYCKMCGIPKQGLLHDLSKFSPIEFIESAKYWTGTRSPIDMCKEKYGYSEAWLHHKGRNKHHYEYWQDNFDKGGEALQVPFEYAVEMICDFIGAARAYMGDGFSFATEWEWWINKRETRAMHDQTKIFISLVLKELVQNLEIRRILNYDTLKDYYNRATVIYKTYPIPEWYIEHMI